MKKYQIREKNGVNYISENLRCVRVFLGKGDFLFEIGSQSTKLQSTLDKWNLHGTEEDGSTYRGFHLSK